MLTILVVVLGMKHYLTVERICEGMANDNCFGIRSGRPVGRPPREIPASFKKYYPMWKDGDITAADFARLIGVSRPTLYKYMKLFEN